MSNPLKFNSPPPLGPRILYQDSKYMIINPHLSLFPPIVFDLLYIYIHTIECLCRASPQTSFSEMENSMSCKPIISSSSEEKTTDHDSFEESGWTMYFEDFFAQNNEEDHNHDRNEHGSFSYDHDGSSSLVSDAASLVVKKSAGDHHGEQVVGLPINNNRSFKYSLSFKKRRTKGALVDDALEDTASSPANSPKVGNVNPFFFFFFLSPFSFPLLSQSIVRCILGFCFLQFVFVYANYLIFFLSSMLLSQPSFLELLCE